MMLILGARQLTSASLLTLVIPPVVFAPLSIPLLAYCEVRMLRICGSY
jgi:hypothetical protein